MTFKKKSNTIQIDLSGAQYLKLLPDNKTPWISKKIRTLAGKRRIRYYVRAGDKSSGLDSQSIKATCGNQNRYIEWDVDRRWLWVENPCQNMKSACVTKLGCAILKWYSL